MRRDSSLGHSLSRPEHPIVIHPALSEKAELSGSDLRWRDASSKAEKNIRKIEKHFSQSSRASGQESYEEDWALVWEEVKTLDLLPGRSDGNVAVWTELVDRMLACDPLVHEARKVIKRMHLVSRSDARDGVLRELSALLKEYGEKIYYWEVHRPSESSDETDNPAPSTRMLPRAQSMYKRLQTILQEESRNDPPMQTMEVSE